MGKGSGTPARLRVSRSLEMAGGDVAAQVIELLALIGGAAHLAMEAEALRESITLAPRAAGKAAAPGGLRAAWV